MTDGKGLFTLPNFLTTSACNEILSIVQSYEPDDLGSVRCLLDKSPHFEDLVTNETIEEICLKLFGTEYRLSALGARIIPSRSDVGAEHSHVTTAHIDYPYRAVVRQTPGIASRFFGVPLGLQVLIPLVDLTLENGATAYLPGSHKRYQMPDQEEFARKLESGEVERLEIGAGTLACWSGPIWHCAMPNQSSSDRGVLTLLFSPPFINHPHLMKNNYERTWLESRSEKFQKLISMHDFAAMVFPQPQKRI
ncbi:phytanoyl-CoA dioxygenase family protein [Thalassospira lucentensis]|uniref:phytanoyl-CoA dioxygenase family protein n=1 Tax=Thalassospira lucentensis TaxID=168935 RepID=UPI0003B3B524|nr:phytanoyl-CoA dioxygenase family protein [Thalassospira lucentensis]RCK18825.1 hypothetical protein TH1_22205 [Thalassospira lucentensis MCCC 1A00383 = DSM 14000]